MCRPWAGGLRASQARGEAGDHYQSIIMSPPPSWLKPSSASAPDQIFRYRILAVRHAPSRMALCLLPGEPCAIRAVPSVRSGRTARSAARGWRMSLRICDVARARRRLAYVKTFIEPSASGKWVCCWEPGPLRSELRAPAAQQATTPAPPPPTSDADSEASDTTDNVKAEIQEKEDPHGQNDHVGRGGQRHS